MPMMINATCSTSKVDTMKAGDYIFAFLLAVISTTLAYRFAIGNQIEQLPLILRQLDPGYLPGDFFLSFAQDFGPRSYFVGLLAWTDQWLSLPWAYAIFTLLSDFALVLVTQWTARNVIGCGRLGAALACVLTLTVSSFHLGDATEIRYLLFQPASLAIPGALWAVGLGLRGRTIAAAIAASLSSLAHPLYGAEFGAIALFSGFFVRLNAGPVAGPGGWFLHCRTLAWRDAIVQTAVGAVILGSFLTIFWLLPYANTMRNDPLSGQELLEILARFRSPHHYIPSLFRPTDYLGTAFFLVAAGFAFYRWSECEPERPTRLALLPMLVVLAACVAGYVFTEVWPLRSVITLQPFRLLSLIKWLGFMWMGYALASYWQRPAGRPTRPLVALSLASGGVTQPIVTLGSLALLRLQPWLRSGLPEWIWVIAPALAACSLWYFKAPPEQTVKLALGLGLVVAFCYPAPYLKWVSGALCLTLAVGLGLNHGKQPPGISLKLVPLFEFDDRHGELAELGRILDEVTPADALIIAPPDSGQLRLIGRRALVVDFKAIPLQDSGMREWRNRLQAIYGNVASGGFPALAEMDRAYRGISDSKLVQLAQKYGASHAVLYSETQSRLPVVYENQNFIVVKIPR